MSYKLIPVSGPWQGIIDSVGKPNAPLAAFDDCQNFITTKGRLRTRPQTTSFGTSPDSRPVFLLRTFQDVNNNYHTLCLTDKTGYYLTSGPTFNSLGYPSGISTLGASGLPFGWAYFNRRLYFSNSSTPLLFTDGSANLKVAGDTPGGSYFLTSLSEYLIQANTVENSVNYPGRVRWSKAGDGNNWSDYSSGATDLIEVGDGITGIARTGDNAIVFHDNGMTLMSPTGTNTPFAFQDFSNETSGVGLKYPYSLATYGGKYCIGVGEDDIYNFIGTSLTPIGGNAKKSIFSDIVNYATGPYPMGFIIPNFGPGFDYLSYWLVINNNRIWVYQCDDNSWVRMFFTTSSPMSFLTGSVLTA